MGLQQYDAAAATFTRSLALVPSDPAARINRAISFLRGGRLDAARADYQDLRKRFPNAYQVLYGLAEIAWRKQDTNTALELYQRYVSAGVPESDEYKLVCERLEGLHARSLAADRSSVSH
jgi:tetratricopeptide (TPR) repeat protein